MWTSGGWEKWPPSAILAEPWFQDVAGEVGHTLLWSLLVATVVTMPLGIVAHRAIKSFGRRMLTGKYLRGAVKVSDEELARQVRRRRQATPFSIGKVPLPPGSECEHLAFIGGPGTGKTQAILALLDAIRARGDAAVIYDSKGTFTSHYFDAERGDVLLNPLDARTRPWSPWAEIEDEMDADRVAHALIPAGDHSTPFFHDTARALLSAALMQDARTPATSPRSSGCCSCSCTPRASEREAFYPGTDVTQIYDKGGERMRVSVEQNLRTYVRTLRYLPLASGGPGDFSILRHIQGIDGRDRQPWLFLPSPLRAKHAAIKPLLTCWLDCAVAALLSCGEQPRPPLLVHRRRGQEPAPPAVLVRPDGGGAQLRRLCRAGLSGPGPAARRLRADDAKTMSAVLGTKVLFRIADPETAKWGADALGEVEEETVKESTRYDAAGDTPKGVQLAAQRVQRHLVMPAELQRQERFHCFVQLSGAWPVAQTTLPHRPRCSANRSPPRSRRPIPSAATPRASPTCPTHRRRTPGRTIRQPTKQRCRRANRTTGAATSSNGTASNPASDTADAPAITPPASRLRRSRAGSEPC